MRDLHFRLPRQLIPSVGGADVSSGATPIPAAARISLPAPVLAPIERCPPPATIRAFPYPYRAMLAVSTDIDGTTIENLRETHRFLNTREMTAMGEGVGLDVANSFWVFNSGRGKSRTVSYYSDWTDRTESAEAEELVEYIRGGWIDTLHSYGNFTGADQHSTKFTRAHALDARELFEKRKIKLAVWTNHGDANNTQNLLHDHSTQGDLPGSEAYHADLLADVGVEYVWRQVAQGVPGHASAVTALRARDERSFFGFPRFNVRVNYPGAARAGMRFNARHGRNRSGAPWIMLWDARVFHEQIHDEVLDEIERNGHFSVMAQHLGFVFPARIFDSHCVAAFRRLRTRQQQGRILVARTSRLLHYNRIRDHVAFSVVPAGERLAIDIGLVQDPVRGAWSPALDDLRGLTFCVERPERWTIQLRGRPIGEAEIARNVGAEGDAAIGIRWFAEDHTDHSRDFAARCGRRSILWNAAVTAEVTELGRRIASTLEAELASPARTAQFHDAARGSIGRYGAGLPHYARVMETIGFAGLDGGLDIGSGAGHWCLAFLQHGARRVAGVDRRAECIDLSRLVAHRFGFDGRASFAVARAESLPFKAQAFAAAWSHGVVEFAVAEQLVAEAARVLQRSGYFYCGHTSNGMRLRAPFASFALGQTAKARAEVQIVLDGHLNRLGVHHTGGGIARTPEVDDLLRTCRAFGMTYLGQPGVQDEAGGFLGFPALADFVVRKTEDHGLVRRRLLDRESIWEDWRSDLRALVTAGCARMVAEVLEERGGQDADDELRQIRVLALLRAGAGQTAPARALIEGYAADGRLDPRTLGLYRYDGGATDRALESFREIDPGAPDREFLIGMCHLAAGRWTSAEAAFSVGFGRDQASVPLALGVVAARLRLDDEAGCRATLRLLFSANRGAASQQSFDEAMELIESGRLRAAPPEAGLGELAEYWWPRLGAVLDHNANK